MAIMVMVPTAVLRTSIMIIEPVEGLMRFERSGGLGLQSLGEFVDLRV